MSSQADQKPALPAGWPAGSPDDSRHAVPVVDLPEGWLAVNALDIDAQGVARRADGKVVFIDGALPTEWVSANVHRKKSSWEQGSLTAIHRFSSQRVTEAAWSHTRQRWR